MKKASILAVATLVCLALTLSGCLDPKWVFVFNQSSSNVSSVNLATGSVAGNVNGISTGNLTNRAVIRQGKAYVVNSGNFPGATGASIKVVNLSTRVVEKTIPLPDGENPWDIAFVSNTKAYVTAWIGNKILVVDPVAGSVTKIIALPDGAGPEGIVISGGFAYTANSGYDASSWSYGPGSVSVIRTSTDTVVDTIATTQINPQDLDVDSDGMLNVVCTGDYFSQFGVVDVIDPETRTVTDSLAVGGSPGNITVAGSYALLGAGDANSCDLFVIDTDDNSVIRGSGNPWTLRTASGWCTVGKIAEGQGSSGIRAYVPAGVWGAEALLFEIEIGTGAPTIGRTFDLAPSANLPAAAVVMY